MHTLGEGKNECLPLEDRSIDFIFHSNAIENVHIPVTVLARRSHYNPTLGHIGAYNMFKKLAEQKQPLQWQSLCEAQKLITEEQKEAGFHIPDDQKGRVRRGGEMVIIAGKTKRAPSESELMHFETDLRNALQECEGKSIEKIIRRAAQLHLDYEEIHPFIDGNGRTGRLLVNYFLAYFNLQPIVFLSDEEMRLRYYRAFPQDDTEVPDYSAMEQLFLELFQISEGRYPR